jgi:hypothetical protein
MSEIRISRNYFPKGNLWTESTSGEQGQACAVHRGLTTARTEGAGARRRAHRSTASGRYGAPKLTGGGAKEREEHGDLSSYGGVATGRCSGVKRSREAQWGGVPARGRGREGLGEVCGAPGVVGVAFIGPGEGAGGVAGVTPAMNSH